MRPHDYLLVIAAALLMLLAFQSLSRAETPGEPAADAKGNLHVPDQYRSRFEYLGTWSVAADTAPGAQSLHEVYASPGAIAAYRKTRQFPAGTVLVKEVYETNTAPMTTGTVSRAQSLKGWFVMLKYDTNNHPDNPLWGDGWAWSWFDAANPRRTTSSDYRKDCLGCHVPAKATDWIYVQGYPALK